MRHEVTEADIELRNDVVSIPFHTSMCASSMHACVLIAWHDIDIWVFTFDLHVSVGTRMIFLALMTIVIYMRLILLI